MSAAALERLRARVEAEAEAFRAAHRTEIEAWRAEIASALGESLRDLRAEVEALTGGDPTSVRLAEQAAEYADWMQWALWDLPPLAAALRPERALFRRRAAGCGLVYLAFRVVDDLLDRHYLYRGRRETLLSSFAREHGEGHEAQGLTVLGALLLAFQGLARLAAQDDDAGALRAALHAGRRTLAGAAFELSREQRFTPEAYARLVGLKNVDYARLLRSAFEPLGTPGLRAFLDAHADLAQRLNDVQDHSLDEPRGQPNFVTVLRDAQPGDARAALEAHLGRDLLALGARLDALSGDERGAAAGLLQSSLDEARRLGLWSARDAEAPPRAAGVGLTWDSSAEEFLERHGPDALAAAPCAVCGADEARLLFRRRGFALRRCPACRHVYVSPRVRADLRAGLARELDAGEDPFLDVQRLHAEHLCRVFRRYARGPRLLDVGCGRGFLLHLAAAHGFEAYGVDGSAARLAELAPVFGRRLAQADAGADAPLPWGAFDVLAASHVLEHLEQPATLLRRARQALNDDGLLYVAVPEADSVQWRLFGRHWDAVSPVAHLHYFTRASLERLVGDCGFEVLSRLEHPPEPPLLVTRATRLYRELGGNETGELALLCRARREQA